ncbi:ABC transporter substrate-binding protein, partial [Neisseria sp. P0017.S006]
ADKFKNVIGISREFWEKFNPGSWAMFKQKLPTLQNIADIGNINTGTFSLEKTLALKPDVLILADWQYKAVATHLPRIKAAGIPVVVVDFNAETVARHTRSAEIFGELNGTQARAQKIAAEYARGIA